MIRLYKLMMIVNVLMVVPFAVEAVRYRKQGIKPPLDMVYIICETAIYLLGILMSSILYLFLFKIKQVELELLIIEKNLDVKTILQMIAKLRRRIRITFSAIAIGSLVFVVSYMYCEIQELDEDGR